MLTLDRTDAASGDRVTAQVSVTNPGPDPLVLPCAAPVDVWADISPVVAGPREDWATTDPWRDKMRRRLLGDPVTAGTGPHAVSLSAVERARCPDTTRTLAAGETIDAAYTWDVGYPDGTPLYGPSDDPAVVRARVVPQVTPTRADAGLDAPPPVTAEAPLRVARARGPRALSRALSPSQAVEALFDDREAAAWLDLEPASTWRRADMRLVRGRWRFDVLRIATGCCRERLSAAIDGLTGDPVRLRAPTFDWTPARTVVRSFGSLELRLELQRRRFQDGRTTRIRLTVTNLSEDEPVWYWAHDNGCVAQPGIWISAGPERGGMRWPGALGRFKRRALRGDLIIAPAGPPQAHRCKAPDPLKLRRHGGSVATESFYQPATVPMGQRTLEALGRIDLVGPRRHSVDQWQVYAAPEVRARFRTDDGSTQVESPATLIDAALSQRPFAQRIRSTPRSRWKDAGVTGRTVWLELKDGSRIVALVP